MSFDAIEANTSDFDGWSEKNAQVKTEPSCHHTKLMAEASASLLCFWIAC